jgi:hypothetical protein
MERSKLEEGTRIKNCQLLPERGTALSYIACDHRTRKDRGASPAFSSCSNKIKAMNSKLNNLFF